MRPAEDKSVPPGDPTSGPDRTSFVKGLVTGRARFAGSELDDVEGGAPGTRAVLGALVDALIPHPPSDEGRRRVLGASRSAGRFGRFVAPIAALVDLPDGPITALLDGLFEHPGWEPGPVAHRTRTLWVAGGPAAQGMIRGFLHVQAGVDFPQHEHLGEERVLVLQGTMILDTGEEIRPGAMCAQAPGSQHSYRALAGGPDLLLFNTIRTGVRLGGGLELRHRDAL